LAGRCCCTDREATSLSGTGCSIEVCTLLRRLNTDLDVQGCQNDVVDFGVTAGVRCQCEGDGAHIPNVLLGVKARVIVPDGLASRAAVSESAQSSRSVAGRYRLSPSVIYNPNRLQVLARVGTSGTLAGEYVRLNCGEGSLDLGGWFASGNVCNALGICYGWENAALLIHSRATLSSLGCNDSVRWAITSPFVYTCEGNGAEGTSRLGRA